MRSLPGRLLTLFQFTRIALVFTAISNGWAGLMLAARANSRPIEVSSLALMTVISIALYTFGMALNDLIDRRRDARVASHRPIPSGRLSVRTAAGVVIVLGLLALLAAGMLTRLYDQSLSLLLCLATLAAIVFYDLAGKYLVALGLLALGVVRCLHAFIPWPAMGHTTFVPWQPLVLLVHVTLLSTVCYHLEGKRPRLTLRHWLGVVGGLAVFIGVCLKIILLRVRPTVHTTTGWVEQLRFTPELGYIAVAGVAFIAVATLVRVTAPDRRAAGRKIMLYGLLWLIVYDALFLYIYVTPGWYALVVLALLPVALLSVQALRAWAKLVELSAAPQYERAR